MKCTVKPKGKPNQTQPNQLTNNLDKNKTKPQASKETNNNEKTQQNKTNPLHLFAETTTTVYS